MPFLRRLLFVSLVLCPVIAFAQADQAIISVVDAPDPVVPGTTLTYTVTFQNNGPNPAVNGGVNLLFDGNFTPTSVLPPAGFSCTALAQIMSCTSPSFAPGAAVVITASGTVAPHLNSFPDGTLTSSFSTSGVTPDPNPGNNSSGNIGTTYNSPQVDLSILVADSPDPVGPNGDVTFTVDLTNGGPDAANSVNFNVFNNGSLRYQSITIPAGWSCTLPAVGATPTFTCSRPTWAPGTSQFIVVLRADPAFLGLNDGTVMTTFSVSAGASDETDDGSDNTETESTAYVTPDADVAITVTDSPDPVFPDGNITYTVTVSNNGPDMAPSINLSSFGANNLRFQSATVPAGWSCTLPPSGTQTTSLSCTAASGLANGASSVLTFVMQADDALLGINDGTILFGFSANSSIADPVPGNNSETESTQYTTPDADVALTVTDSPDPVFPDGNITYTVTVSNNGPDMAPSVTLNSFGANNLRFQSATVPAGWNCTLPASGTQTTSYSCTLPGGLTSGASSVLTFVMQADDALLGINDQTILFGFSANSPIADPVGANNSETESTQYTTPDADINITASDSPDPVAPDGDITYSVTVTNQGPDTPANTTLDVVGNGGQTRFVSLTAPAGWTCTPPAPGTLLNANFQCTNPSFANGASAVFTVVTEASDDLHPNSDHNITQSFQTSSSASDPDGTDNSVTVTTAYVVPDADMNITVSDSPDPVNPDGDITYTVTVTNQGPDAATNATMTIAGNGGQTRFQSITAPAGWTCIVPATGTLLNVTSYNCNIPSLANGAAAVFTVVTEASDDLHPASDHNITQTFTTTANEVDPDNADNSETETTLYDVLNADISVSNADSPDPVAPGDTISYSQSITNLGPDMAGSVTFNQNTPAGTTFQSFLSPAGWTCATPASGATGAINCSKASMAAGETGTFTLTVNVTGTGTITSTVTGGSTSSDPDPSNNQTDAVTTSIAPPDADLSVAKSTPATSALEGTAITYTISLTNNGPDAAADVEMQDALPASLLFQSITAPAGWACVTPAAGATGTITCMAASLANGSTAIFTLVTTVNASSGTVTNTASAVHSGTDSNTGNSSSTTPPIPIVAANADISISKTTATTSAMTGTVFNYTLTAANAGPSTATSVVVTDVLPAGLTAVAAVPSQGSCSGTTTITCSLGSILSGAGATITLTVQVAATTGTIVNSASIVAAEPDSDPTNNSSSTPPIPVAGPGQIPTLSEWMLLALMAMLGVVAMLRMRT